MKTHKVGLGSKQFFIDRKFLSKIGNSIYFNEEVSGVKIQVKFKDKTRLEYSRHHVIDEIENELESEGNNKECEDDSDD